MFDIFRYAKDSHESARDKGFYDAGHSSALIPTKLALILTEIYEASDAFHGIPDDKGEISSFEDEMADIVIRASDLAGYLIYHAEGYDPKVAYNAQDYVKHSPDDFAFLSRLVAQMVQLDRKTLNDRERNSLLLSHLHSFIDAVIHVYYRKYVQYKSAYLPNKESPFTVEASDLHSAIMNKLRSNVSRPKYHGRRY